ncbi:Tetratricopeptide repeat-containing protein [Streptomyces sp. Ag109_G2-15]|nr:Tetratricopeptide repeat-containing protein [Streptomyces sp. Ag109_G2-15]
MGSGYLLGPQLVLTALHVVLHKGRWAQQVVARVGHPRYGASPVERAAQVCWPDPRHGIPPRDALDVALLWLDAPVHVDGKPVRWGRPSGVAPLAFEGAGFPAFAAEENGAQAQFEYLRGELPVVSTASSSWVLDCPVWPAHRADGQRPWRGASGSAVFCHGRLVGVAVEDDRGMDWRRLHAVPIHEALRSSGFADLVRRHGHPGTPTTVEEVTAEAGAASWPRQVGVVPRLARAFQLRDAVADLAQALTHGDTVVRSAAPAGAAGVVTGIGGVGKTQLAVHYAHAVRAASGWPAPKAQNGAGEGDRGRPWSVPVGAVDLLVWVQASTTQAVVAAYAQAAAAISHLAGADNMTTDDQEGAARWFLAWLQTTTRPWLVVLDDVPDAGALSGLWPPETPSGRTLITTRNRDTSLTTDRIEVVVGLFTDTEAVHYLTTRLAPHRQDLSTKDLHALAGELGHLPLALAQAASYIIENRLTVAQYRIELADRTSTLEDVLPDISGLPDDQRHTVTAAWTLSINYADTQRPLGLAGPLLELISLLDPNGIPAPVLQSPSVRSYLDQHRKTTVASGGSATAPPRLANTADVNKALHVLHRLHLAEVDFASPDQTVRVHQLVQRAIRDTLTIEERERLSRAAADGLTSAWPEVDRDTDLAQTLRANADALSHHAMQALHHPDTHPVLFRTGKSLGEAGQTTAAIAHFQDLTESVHQCLGLEHPDALAARHELAYWRGHNGDAAGTAVALAGVFADRVRILGPDHPDTLTTGHELAHWRGHSGDAEGAAVALAGVFADRVRILGPDHPDTLTSRNELAYWLGEAGDAAGAAAAYAELLEDRVRILGPDHPDTLITRHELAYWLTEAGDAAGAAAAYAELLEDRVRILGPDHLHTLATRHDFAHCLGKAGDADGAAAAYTELLADRVRILGPDHLHTLATRTRLAHWRGEAGNPALAASVLAQLLSDHMRILGPDHLQTLDTRYDLAHWLREAGDADGAAAAYTELLADRVRILGPDHPGTLGTRHDLARCLGEAGDAVGAAAAYAELLEDRLRIQGPDHPDTLVTRDELAYCLSEAGDAAGATATYTSLLAKRLRILGPDHPDTLATRHELARCLGKGGDAAGAAAAYNGLLAKRVRVLGPDHPDTLATRHELAHWRGHSGDPSGAATAYAELLLDQVRVLGPDHPDTLATRHNLAHWQGYGGDATGAATAFAELLEARTRILGPDHPITLHTRNELAYWRGHGGDALGAAASYAELLEHALRVLGPDHPISLIARNNLAHQLGEAGDATGAATTFTAILEDNMRSKGRYHPETLTARRNLAQWRGQAGDAVGAVAAYAELLEDLVRTDGRYRYHLDTLTIRHELTRWRREVQRKGPSNTDG